MSCKCTEIGAMCGDGVEDAGEECDVGGMYVDESQQAYYLRLNNACEGDSYCDPTQCGCVAPGEMCGDGIIAGEEVCDVGPMFEGEEDIQYYERLNYACDGAAYCDPMTCGCVAAGPGCGDGVVAGEEVCDVGPMLEGETESDYFLRLDAVCEGSAFCHPEDCACVQQELWCGDGMITAGEQCDAGMQGEMSDEAWMEQLYGACAGESICDQCACVPYGMPVESTIPETTIPEEPPMSEEPPMPEKPTPETTAPETTATTTAKETTTVPETTTTIPDQYFNYPVYPLLEQSLVEPPGPIKLDINPEDLPVCLKKKQQCLKKQQQ